MKKIIFTTLLFVFASANVMAQCYLDRHNTNWFDGWLSCNTSMNPNAMRGESHWILYNLNELYELHQLHIWNTNAPDYLTSGMQSIAIDISDDGVTWTSVGEFEIPMADGSSTYEGLDLYDFEGTNAQYVLITGLSNHGGSCFGLSEMRIDVREEVIVGVEDKPLNSGCLSANIFPNPISAFSKAIITSDCSRAPIQYSIQDISGKTIKTGVITMFADEVELDLNALPIVAGSYVLSLQQQDVVQRFKMVKVD
ncbi:MAG: discoidin domain-containing protein [Bacteroidota bacterium]